MWYDVLDTSTARGSLSTHILIPPLQIHFDFKGTSLETYLTGGFVKMPPSRLETHKPMGEVLYFYVEDLEAALDRVHQAGGQVVSGRDKVDEFGWAAGFIDTEGNRHGVYTNNPAK